MSASLGGSRRCYTVSRCGFTLIELAIGVLIVGILAGVAAPKFSRSLSRIRLDSACRRVCADLRFARQQAISGSCTQSVQFSPETGDYTLAGLADINQSRGTYTVKLAQPPYQAVIVTASLGGDAAVIFDRYGQPDSAGVVILRSGAFQQSITIAVDSGQVSTP